MSRSFESEYYRDGNGDLRLTPAGVEMLRLEREAKAKRERDDYLSRSLPDEILKARIDLGYGFSVARAMRLITALDRQRGSATVWTRERGPCAAGTTIYTRPIVSETDLATWAHEYSHAMTPPCPQTGSHKRTVIENSACCVQCEADAWAGALRCIPFSRPMFERLTFCLESYLWRIPAPAAAKRDARRYTLGTAWRLAQHHQLETHIRLEKYGEMMQWIL